MVPLTSWLRACPSSAETRYVHPPVDRPAVVSAVEATGSTQLASCACAGDDLQDEHRQCWNWCSGRCTPAQRSQASQTPLFSPPLLQHTQHRRESSLRSLHPSPKEACVPSGLAFAGAVPSRTGWLLRPVVLIFLWPSSCPPMAETTVPCGPAHEFATGCGLHHGCAPPMGCGPSHRLRHPPTAAASATGWSLPNVCAPPSSPHQRLRPPHRTHGHHTGTPRLHALLTNPHTRPLRPREEPTRRC